MWPTPHRFIEPKENSGERATPESAGAVAALFMHENEIH